jgi:hypothetical protein
VSTQLAQLDVESGKLTPPNHQLTSSGKTSDFSPEEEDTMKALISLSKPDYVALPLLLSRSFLNLIRQPHLFYS